MWHLKTLNLLPKVRKILLIGQYAQRYYLGSSCKKFLRETAGSWKEYLPTYFPLPHPSGRNNSWLKENSWFEQETLPELQESIHAISNL